MAVLVPNRQQGMQQPLLKEVGVTVLNGGLNALAITNRPFPGSRNLAVVVKTNDHRHRQPAGHIQTSENLDADIQVGGPFFDRIHIGEIGEVT